MKYYIAIDAGGTKTDSVLFDQEGHVLARDLRRGANAFDSVSYTHLDVYKRQSPDSCISWGWRDSLAVTTTQCCPHRVQTASQGVTMR